MIKPEGYEGFDAVVKANLSDLEVYTALLHLAHRAELPSVLESIREAKLSTINHAARSQAYYMRKQKERGISMTNNSPHEKDSDCDVDPQTNCCRVCGVDHSGQCPVCGGRGFHKEGCANG